VVPALQQVLVQELVLLLLCCLLPVQEQRLWR
jgi:hypothetical protein